MMLAVLNAFQWVMLPLLALFLAGGILAAARGGLGRRAGLTWAVVWLGAAVAVIWPDVTQWLANRLGITRGADLIFYCAVLVMLIGFWMVYLRLRRMREDITRLVRHLALREANRESPSGGHEDAARAGADSPREPE